MDSPFFSSQFLQRLYKGDYKMINNLVRDVISSVYRDHYDTQLNVIVNDKYIDTFLWIANKYSVKIQTVKESDHHIVAIAMKYKNYLKFMNALRLYRMNLSENTTFDGSTKNGLITEVVSWEEA